MRFSLLDAMFEAHAMTPDLLELLRSKTPLPLSEYAANRQAFYLRTEYDLSYTAVTAVMESYHGARKTPEAWRRTCRKQGATVTRPHNVPPQMRRLAA